MSAEPRMPKVNFDKDKVPEYIKDQIKAIEKDNRRRVFEFRRILRGGRLSGLFWGGLATFIYGYTIYAVKQETFLDNFDYPNEDDD